MGVSVTQRISEISQPRGGYLKPKDFEKIELKSNNTLYDEENIHSSLVGLAVDYLTRFMLNKDVDKAFAISLLGAKIGNFGDIADKFLTKIKGLDDQSIIYACKLAGFDVIYRAGFIGYKPVNEINPDEKTIFNIREMVSRSLAFFEKYGPITVDGFTFEGKKEKPPYACNNCSSRNKCKHERYIYSAKNADAAVGRRRSEF